MANLKLIGPFTQLLTMDNLELKGPIHDEQLEILQGAGILIEDEKILNVGRFQDLRRESNIKPESHTEINGDAVALPGFIDPHTHMCFAGSRANDYALRIAGKTYLEIAKEGGGIWQTVQKTREADKSVLTELTLQRAISHLKTGVTTTEIKSGYGLDLDNEIKMLEVINEVNELAEIDIVPTCLAAHIIPQEFKGKSEEYLGLVLKELLPKVKQRNLAWRVDIFIEQSAFNVLEAKKYLVEAKNLGFNLTVHGDQFTPGGSKVAIETGSVSVDHLEASTDIEIKALAKSNVIATVLPGASIGLGMPFAPARKLLDEGNCVAIGSDWNPGSAPMGNLLVQAAIMSAAEKLTNAETFAGLSFRAAEALRLNDRGTLSYGKLADIVVFPCRDFREILYHQGQLKPDLIIKKGNKI